MAERAWDAIVETGRALAAAGLAPGASGNVSVRDVDRILMTPTGTRLGALDPGSLSVLALDGPRIAGPKPSKEWPLHVALYAARPDAGAIVHLHSADSVAVACLADLDPADALPPYTAYQVMRIGRLPLVPYVAPGDPSLGSRAAECAPAAGRGLLLANHGLVAWGRDLADAAAIAEEIEAACALHLRLRDRPVRLLTPDEIADLRARYP